MKRSNTFLYSIGSQTQTSLGRVESIFLPISYGDIKLPSTYENIKELENQHLKQELEVLKIKVSKLEEARKKSEIFDDEEATKEIEKYLAYIKSKGRTKVDILTLASATDLPLDQIDRIMSRLKEKGIKEAV